jgi:hypothetical protein
MKSKPLLLAGLLLACASSKSHADITIDWGTAAFSSMVDSSGTGLFDSSYRFEMGAFATGFTPTAANMSLWQSNWLGIAETGTAAAGVNLSLGYVAGTFTLRDTAPGVGGSLANSRIYDPNDNSNIPSGFDANLFSTGIQGYMWVYKDNKTYQNGLEWALLTNSQWNASASEIDGSIPTTEVWNVSEPGTTAVFGGVYDTQGPGVYSTPTVRHPEDTLANGGTPATFEIQTHTVNIAPVPEPGAALMIGSIGMLSLLRRRRLA